MINVTKKVIQFSCLWGTIKESFSLFISIRKLYYNISLLVDAMNFSYKNFFPGFPIYISIYVVFYLQDALWKVKLTGGFQRLSAYSVLPFSLHVKSSRTLAFNMPEFLVLHTKSGIDIEILLCLFLSCHDVPQVTFWLDAIFGGARITRRPALPLTSELSDSVEWAMETPIFSYVLCMYNGRRGVWSRITIPI